MTKKGTVATEEVETMFLLKASLDDGCMLQIKDDGVVWWRIEIAGKLWTGEVDRHHTAVKSLKEAPPL